MNDNRPPSYDSLLLAHEPYIRSRMYALEKDTSRHEDIYQSVIAIALERWHQYRPAGNFAGWLYWIVRSVVYRKERAPRGPVLRAYEPTQEYAADLSLAMDRCKDEVLLSACGHSEADIARRCGVTGAAVHYRLKAGRAALNDSAPGHARKAA